MKSITLQFWDGSAWVAELGQLEPGADGETPIGPPAAIEIVLELKYRRQAGRTTPNLRSRARVPPRDQRADRQQLLEPRHESRLSSASRRPSMTTEVSTDHVDHVESVGPQPRRGIVLLAVLVVIVLLSLAAYQYSDLMLAEYKASVNAQRRRAGPRLRRFGHPLRRRPDQQPREPGGRQRQHLRQPRDLPRRRRRRRTTKGIGPLHARSRPADPEDASGGTRGHGVTDESGKINPNALMKLDPKGQLLYDALMKLPNMTDELAACIVDWLDADDEPRQGGAESDYYCGEAKPYLCKNAPLDTPGRAAAGQGHHARGAVRQRSQRQRHPGRRRGRATPRASAAAWRRI